MKVKTSSKGQVVIPREIREKLGIKPGTILNVKAEDRRVILELAPEAPDVFVEAGEIAEKSLRAAKESSDKAEKLLRDLGVS
jgi:AbrB family looped-hinge helix DNA binding protein